MPLAALVAAANPVTAGGAALKNEDGMGLANEDGTALTNEGA